MDAVETEGISSMQELLERRLRELEDDAVKTIREILGGTDIPPGVRLKAA